MVKVYLVIIGEHYEASTIQKIFDTKAKARNYINKYLNKQNHYKKSDYDKDVWYWGVDYIKIETMEVE